MRQGEKLGTLKVTKPTSPTLAGEIRSTSEDTSGWSTDASGNKIDNGRLALSTSASTTITACETLYPDLWAKAPTGWRSGSNLVVPAQGGNMVGEWVSYTPSPTGFTASAINGFYRVVGDSIEIKVRAVISSVSGSMKVSIPSGFTEDSSKYPLSVANNFYGSASALDANLNAMWTGNPYIASGGVISFYGPDGSSSVWDAADPFTWASGDTLNFEITIPVTELAETNTPYIQAYNNIAAGALGLPEATATQAGTVSAEDEGTLSLTLTNNGGLDSTPTLGSTEYHRIGKMVFCWFEMTIDPTASGNFSVTFPRSELPFGPKNYTITGNCWKSGNNDSNNSGQVSQLLSNTVYVSGKSTTITSHTYRVAFNYMID